MSIATLKKKTQAIYQTQNNLNLSKKEVSYCSESCKNIYDKPAYLNTNQTFTGTNVFDVLPKSSAVASSNNDLVNKLYVDIATSGVNSVAVLTTFVPQTIDGLKTFNVLPQSSVIPSNTNDLVTKSYVDGSSTITGLKTFNVLPQSSDTPSDTKDLVTKDYVDKSNGKYHPLSLPANYTLSTDETYKNGTIHILPTANNLTLTMQQPNYIALKNSTQVFYNDSSYTLVLASHDSRTFQGKYGSYKSTYVLPPNSWLKLLSDGVNWLVTDRSVNFTYKILNVNNLSPSDFNGFYNYLSCNLQLSFSADSSINWLDATNKISCFTTTKIYNIGTIKITLNSSAGIFTGKYGSNSTILIIPANTWVEVFSNGTNWEINSRSIDGQIYYPNTITSTNSQVLLSNFQYIDSELHLTSSGENFNIPIPDASNAYSLNKKYTIYNDNLISASPNSYNISLMSNSQFKGPFQTNTDTSYNINPNSRVVFYSNGTNWIITDYGQFGNQSIPIQGTSGTDILSRPLKKFTIINKIGSGANYPITLPTPQKTDVGQEIVIRLGFRSSGGGIYLSATNSQPIFGLTTNQGIETTNYQTTYQSIRLTVLQYGYAGSGSITLTDVSNVAIISGMSTGSISPLSVLTVNSGTIVNVIIDSTTLVSQSGVGRNGNYKLTVPWNSTGGTYSFTCSDFYAWTLC